MEQMNEEIKLTDIDKIVSEARPEDIFKLYSDIMNVNLVKGDLLHEELKVGYVFAEKTGQFDLADEKVAMIPEHLEKPNAEVEKMSKDAWKRFQQKYMQQELTEEHTRTR